MTRRRKKIFRNLGAYPRYAKDLRSHTFLNKLSMLQASKVPASGLFLLFGLVFGLVLILTGKIGSFFHGLVGAFKTFFYFISCLKTKAFCYGRWDGIS